MTPGSHILVVDDNAEFRQVLATALRTNGYRVAEAANGEQALLSMAKSLPDLAIIDLDMPGVNGLALSKSVKDTFPGLPIIMVTGYARLYSPAELFSVGIDAFLEKPVPMERLLDVIQKIRPA